MVFTMQHSRAFALFRPPAFGEPTFTAGNCSPSRKPSQPGISKVIKTRVQGLLRPSRSSAWCWTNMILNNRQGAPWHTSTFARLNGHGGQWSPCQGPTAWRHIGAGKLYFEWVAGNAKQAVTDDLSPEQA